jgi:signal transduction histidine kinase
MLEVGPAVKIVLSQEVEGGATNPCLTVEIIDDGPGISEEQQARVFDRFYRVDQGGSRETGGAGLGLAIAKWAVQVNGGEIGLKTSPTGGCNFFIRMPWHHSPLEKEKQLSGIN